MGRAMLSFKSNNLKLPTFWRLHLKCSIATLGALFIIGLTTWPLVAQDYRPVCYIEEADGSYRDLSALCGAQTTRDVPRSPEDLFFESFQQQIQQYPPAVQNNLSSYPRDNAVASGQWICQTLRRGGQNAVAIRRQALLERDRSNSNAAKQEILHTAATRHLCS